MTSLIRGVLAGPAEQLDPQTSGKSYPILMTRLSDRLIHARAGMQYVPYHGSLLTMSSISTRPEEMASESSSFESFSEGVRD